MLDITFKILKIEDPDNIFRSRWVWWPSDSTVSPTYTNWAVSLDWIDAEGWPDRFLNAWNGFLDIYYYREHGEYLD